MENNGNGLTAEQIVRAILVGQHIRDLKVELTETGFRADVVLLRSAEVIRVDLVPVKGSTK